MAAHARWLELKKQIFDVINREYNKFTEVDKAALMRNIPAGHGLTDPETGEEVELKLKDLLGIALNMGTELNRWHLEDGGWKWNPDTYGKVLDEHFTSKMLDFVAAIHDLMENTMWPLIADHEFTTSGLAPQKEAATPFRIANREFPGGYFTLARDPIRAPLSTTSSPDISAMFKDKIITPSTPSGFTKKRVSAQYPVWLDWGSVLFHHVNDVSKRIAYQEYVSSVMRFLAQKEVKQLLAYYGGPEANALIMDNLQRQTGVSLIGPETHGIVNWVFRGMRKNFYLVKAAGKAAIALEHASAIPQAMMVMGHTATMDGYRRSILNLPGTIKFAWSSSAYLRGRRDEVDMNMRDLADDIDGRRGVLGLVDRGFAQMGINTDVGMIPRLTQKGMMAIIGWVNHYLIAVPHWTGAYYAAREGTASLHGVPQSQMEHEDAVAFADKVVSLAHGSGAAMDLSRLQDGYNEVWKFLNVFSNYHGTQGNLEKGALNRLLRGRTARERAQGLYQYALAVLTIFLGAVAGGAYEIDKLIGTPGKPPTPKSQLSWALDTYLSGEAARIPGGRELETAREGWFERHHIDYDVSPATDIIITPLKAAGALGDMAQGKPAPTNAARDLIEGSSYILGVAGGSQIGNTTQGFIDLGKPGNVHPIKGVLFGPSAEKDARDRGGGTHAPFLAEQTGY